MTFPVALLQHLVEIVREEYGEEVLDELVSKALSLPDEIPTEES